MEASIIAMLPYEGLAFIKANNKTFLLRPPYDDLNQIIVDDGVLLRAICVEGFNEVSIEFDSVREAINFIKEKYVELHRARNKQLPSDEDLLELLDYASIDVIEEYLDSVDFNAVPKGKLDITEKILKKLITLDSINQNTELINRVNTNLEIVNSKKNSRKSTSKSTSKTTSDFSVEQNQFDNSNLAIERLPKPLSYEDEERYVAAFRSGDQAARDILIERNLRLVAHIVKKYTSHAGESDDLISIGTIGLIKAISTFDQNKGQRLAAYAARCIENEILMHIRLEKKLKSEVSLQDPIGVDQEGNEVTLSDVISNGPDEIADEVDLRLQVKRLYNKMQAVLLKRERSVLELRYGLKDGTTKTQEEIAKIFGISRSYVARIEKRAIRKIARTKTEND